MSSGIACKEDKKAWTEIEGMDKEFYTMIIADLSNDDIEAKIYTEVKGKCSRQKG